MNDVDNLNYFLIIPYMDEIKQVLVDLIEKNKEMLGLSDKTVELLMADLKTEAQTANDNADKMKDDGAAEAFKSVTGKDVVVEDDKMVECEDDKKPEAVVVAVEQKPKNPLEQIVMLLKKSQ